MLVVFDSNVFHGDVRANRSRLHAILDGAVAKGIFELFVPEVVLQELDKQFGKRSKRVARDINKALGSHTTELTELGLPVPERMALDEADIADYRTALQRRLDQVGAEVMSVPADLSQAVSWAIARRKPFKESGEGFPDAVIWLTVLELADAREEEIVLVSSNTRDFCAGDPPQLAEALRQDLVDRGHPPDRVRVVPGIVTFADEVAELLTSATERAEVLFEEGHFGNAIDNALLYTQIDQGLLGLGVDLDNDPLVTAVDVESHRVTQAAELPDDALVIDATVETTVALELLIYRADFYSDDEDPPYAVINLDYNESYVEAESEAVLEFDLSITTSPDGSDPQVEIAEVRRAPLEIVHQALREPGHTDLIEALGEMIGAARVTEYTPEEPIESDIDEVTILAFNDRAGSVRLRELIESEDGRHSCDLVMRVEADVQWSANAPTPFDAEHFASLVLNESSDAPILAGTESFASLVIDVVATWDPAQGWMDLEVNEVKLDADVAQRRSAAGTAADHFLENL